LQLPLDQIFVYEWKLSILYKTTIILLRHYLIGIAITLIVFWSINEIPGLHYFQLHQTEWISTIVSIPLIGLIMAKLLSNRLKKTSKRLYPYASLTLMMTWVFVLYFKAATVGIFESIERQQAEFFDALIGFTMYQLWIYVLIGIIHGLLGGLFLSIDLKKNLKKLMNQTKRTCDECESASLKNSSRHVTGLIQDH
jgi:uncharacterized membrane-anchored protein YhcB (DUF1043 family)